MSYLTMYSNPAIALMAGVALVIVGMELWVAIRINRTPFRSLPFWVLFTKDERIPAVVKWSYAFLQVVFLALFAAFVFAHQPQA